MQRSTDMQGIKKKVASVSDFQFTGKVLGKGNFARVEEAVHGVLDVKTPSTAAQWLEVSRDFDALWNFPNTIGAMDGKHVVFRAPRCEGSTYYNYKGTNSIVLLALVDANYNFLVVDVGTNGRISDGGVFRKSNLAAALERNTLNIPEEKALPGHTMKVPYVIVADAAFPLTTNILKPFPFRNMSHEQVIFNYRLSRARRVVENAFGILSNRFRIFLTTINLSAKKVKKITLACCALHNFLKAENPNYTCTNTENDNDDNNYVFRYALSQQAGNRSRQQAQSVRDEFMAYVNGVGTVPWQEDMV